MDTLKSKVAARYLGTHSPDLWLTRQMVANICPDCASRMATLGIRQVRASVFLAKAKEAGWEGLPKGWTEDSLKKFWDNLTGDRKHKVTACIKKMEGKVDDAGAFCGSLADKMEPGWRSRDASR